MVSFNIETLKSGANSSSQTLFIEFDVAIATFKNLLKMAVLKERLNTDVHRKDGLKAFKYVHMYNYIYNYIRIISPSVGSLKQSTIFTSTRFFIGHSSFISNFLVHFCEKIHICHTVLVRSRMQKVQIFSEYKIQFFIGGKFHISVSPIFSAILAF